MSSIHYFFLFVVVWVLLLAVVPVHAQEQGFNSTIPGERNIGQWYNFTIENVSGYKQASYHYTVYRAYFVNDYQYHDENWGQWFDQFPTQGNKYLFVWIAGYLDDSSTDWWGWDQDRFPIWYNNEAIQPEPVIMASSQYVGIFRGNDHPRIIAGMENTSYLDGFTWSGDEYGFYDGIQVDRMEPGITNAMQGYAIYQVPIESNLLSVRVAMNTYTDQAWWNLENKSFEQVDDVGRQRRTDNQIIQTQIVQGIRLPDNYEEKRAEA